jgi:hypothetical protein
LVKSGLLLVAVSVAATGCRDHLYQFLSIAQGDAGIIDARARRDATGTPDLRLGTGGTVGPDGGAGGKAGAGGAPGTGGVGGGFQTCNANSPDLQIDPANCGACFHQCSTINGTPSCVKGVCQITCQPGFYDADQNPANGCECVKTNNGVEICDGLDNDCNGIVDDGFNFMTDLNNCGACNHQCAFPFANASCNNGVCTQGACLPNFYDRDPSTPGCETQCIKTNNGVEICDGLDNDCDGIVDNNLAAPTITCLTKGVCAGTQPTCSGQNGWVCNYPATYEINEDTKFGCDGLDNDCNGVTDEAYQIGKSCIYGTGPCAGTGTLQCNSAKTDHVCVGSMKQPGVETCNGLDDDCDGVVDNINSMSTTNDSLIYISSTNVTMYAYEASRYDATSTSAGFDSTRRGCSLPGKLPWTNVTMAEAEKACQLLNGPTAPYSSTGWRLCTASDWQAACEGSAKTIFPYGANYVKADCNGNDYERAIATVPPDAGVPAPAPIPTGQAGSCVSVISTTPSLKLFDMSGNVKEWTLTDLTSKNPLSNPSCSTPPCLFELRGGAYDINSFTVGTTTSAPGLQCDASIPAPYSTTKNTDGGTTTQGIDVRLPSVGFRCCLPGQLPP